MRTKFFLKSSGRAAVLATLLMGGTALYFGTLATSAGATQDHAAHGAAVQAAEPQTGGGHGSGHGTSEQVKREETQSGSQDSGHGSGYGAHSGWPEPRQLGGDFSLTDHTGRKVTLADFKGKAAAFYFGYAQCGDICPIIGTKRLLLRLCAVRRHLPDHRHQARHGSRSDGRQSGSDQHRHGQCR